MAGDARIRFVIKVMNEDRTDEVEMEAVVQQAQNIPRVGEHVAVGPALQAIVTAVGWNVDMTEATVELLGNGLSVRSLDKDRWS